MSFLRTQNQIVRDFLAELLGTLFFIAIGNGGTAHGILSRGVAAAFMIYYTWQVGLFGGLLIGVNVTGGHLNPIVTLSFASLGKISWRRVPGCILGQCFGVLIADLLVYGIHYEALVEYDPLEERNLTTAIIFATFPKTFVSFWTDFFDSVTSTSLLMMSVMAAVDTKNGGGPIWTYPLYIGFFVLALGIAFGLNSLAPLNPAREIIGRLFLSLAGWSSDNYTDVQYHHWWVTGVFGANIGGILGSWLYFLCVELHFPERKKELKEVDIM